MREKKIFRLMLPALTLLIASLACNLNTITVECNVPDLIDAINQANSNASHTTLELDPGCTYTLTAVDNTATSTFGGSIFEYGDNGLPQITTPITINGNDAIIIRGSSAPHFRIFFITNTGSLTINDLTLQNGFADGTLPGGGGSAFPGSGGAIYNSGSVLEVNGSTLQANQATFHGGAIFAISDATTYINDSTIHDNTAPRGGGIFIYHGGLLSVDNSEISENSANSGGGGISLDYGAELIVNASLIASNHAGRRGGGIFKDAGADRLPTTITGTTFQDNTADWSGGGVFIWRTPLTISDSQFIHNQAEEYGGGLGYQNNSTETVLISNTTFDDNSATLDGGAIHFSGELMSINNSKIRDNLAENGAGIHNGPVDDPKYIIRADTTLIITSSTVQGNIASGDGGGAFNAGVMTCGESNFVDNESFTLGGGIHNTGEVEVVGCTFDGNQTGFDGGGINNYNIAEIRGSTFANNTSTRGGGFTSIGGDAEIIDSTFHNNSASDRGGAIFNFGALLGSSPMNIHRCDITDNAAPLGGGVATSMGDTKISESTISGNVASSEGGGIYNDGLMKITQSTLSANTASTLGGGIQNIEEINVQDSTFEGNTASKGGGLAAVGGDTDLTNSTFSANTATDSGGGLFNMGLLIDEATSVGDMQAVHITIAYNSAPTGGGIATSGGKLDIKNSIVAHSASGSDCQSSPADFSGIGENIDTDGSCTGFTLTDDPLLDTLANYGGPTETHALKAGSPAMDAAPDCTTIGGAPVSADQRGQPRPGGPICDLGAYEDQAGNPAPPPPQACTFTAAVNLFCRLGPGASIYPDVDSFTPGQSASVVGQTADGVYVFVEGPNSNRVCVVPVAARFGELNGDCSSLPVLIPPPPPEPTKTPTPPRMGCTVRGVTGALTCQVPCPPNAVPGDPCTP